MTDFEYVAEIPIRYRDLDTWGHVNNVVYGTYLEEARSEYRDAVLDDPMEDRDFVIAHLELDYLDSLELDDDCLVAIRVKNLGESSLTFEYEVRNGDGVAATGESTQVHVTPDGSPIPLPDRWRAAITEFEPGLP